MNGHTYEPVRHIRRGVSKLQWFLAGILVGLACDILIRAAALLT